MARSGSDENRSANAELTAEQNQAFNTGQSAVGQFQQNYATLRRGGQVAPNPWQSASYLGNVNRLQSGALNAEQGAADASLRGLNRRTGGMNGTAVTGAMRDLALQKMRLGSQLSSERAAQDYNKNVGYQTQMAAMPLDVTAAESPYYGTATSGRAASLKNLTDLGIAAYGPWMSAITAAGQAAGGAMTGCPAKGSLYQMADGTHQRVEDLSVGDKLQGIDSEPQTIEEIQLAESPVLRIVTNDGFTLRCSRVHAFALPAGGFTVAIHALGKTIRTKLGTGRIVSIEPDGVDLVFNVITDGSHTYCADGMWSLGVGEAERHVAMDTWNRIGDHLERTAAVRL